MANRLPSQVNSPCKHSSYGDNAGTRKRRPACCKAHYFSAICCSAWRCCAPWCGWVIALELMASLTVAFIGVYALSNDRTAFLDVAMVLALTAFLTAVGFARYLEKGGHRGDQ